jgi:protein SCO1/2
MFLNRIPRQVVFFLLSLLCFPVSCLGLEQNNEMSPGEMLVAASQNVDREWVTEKTGEFIPLDTIFTDEHGKEVTLRSLIDKPTLILPIYFFCPSACSKNLANMAVAMNRMSFEPGADYRPIALSFSDTENSDNALRAKQNYLKLVYDGFPAEEWKFLTGDSQAIKTVTDALGYRFKKLDNETYIHPSTIIAIGKDGKIIRYVYGTFVPGDIDMAISSAREGIPALSVKRFLEFCLNYDPDQNKSVFQYVKVAVLLFFTVGIILVFYFSRKKKSKVNQDK